MTRPTLLRRETAAERGPAARAGMLILAALLVLPQVALPATIVVDNAGCTLADAIEAANTDAPVAGCVAGDPGADTIELTADVDLTGVETYFYGPTGTPVVYSDITIDGAGFTVERAPIDGDGDDFRIFAVNPSGTLTLNDVTVTNGDAGSEYYYYTGPQSTEGSGKRPGVPEGYYYYISYEGGGILNRGGTLTISNSTITGNRTSQYYEVEGYGYYGNYGRGGGIASSPPLDEGYGGEINIIDSTVSDNYSVDQGGGIHASHPLTITNSTISGNSADADGGGVNAQPYYYYGESGAGTPPLVIANSTISGNTSQDDGGGVDSSTAVEVSYSTIADNVAYDDGGGMRISGYGASTIGNTTFSGNRAGSSPPEGGDGRGGGLNARTRSYYGGGEGYQSAELTITNSTFSGNEAYSGGGMWTRHSNYGGYGPEGEETPPATLRNVTFSGNQASYDPMGPGKGSGAKGGLGSGAGEGGYSSGGASISAQGYDSYEGGPGTDGAILENTILGYPDGDDHCVGDIGDGGGNLDDDGSCGGGFGALAGLNPLLADNGGPTQTHALEAGSTAIDAGGECGLAADQRGFPRDLLCDSGAFEAGGVEFTCDDIRDLNALILATDPGEFVFGSYRIIMGYITLAAARNCDLGDLRDAVSLLGRIVERTDGNPMPGDWMTCGLGIVCPRDEIHDFALAIQEYFKTLLP